MKLKENYLIKLIIFVLCIYPISVKAKENEIGKKLFNLNCIACHKNGQNVIIPEKNLKHKTLEANRMNSESAINYQIINGKNGMTAFGGRLKEEEVKKITSYVLEQAATNFEN